MLPDIEKDEPTNEGHINKSNLFTGTAAEEKVDSALNSSGLDLIDAKVKA